MPLLDDVLKWTEKSLPLWQRDAARRLFQQRFGLSLDDYAELYTLLKQSHGLSIQNGLVPKPLDATHLPMALQAGDTVVLKALRDLKHVNRIAPGQKLPFSPMGMTVVYGGNGSGKSGYVRVMKRACRARDKSENVHTDARDSTAALFNVPEATFDIEINGASREVKWNLDSKSPDELATLAVFDSYCARSYVTAEKDVAYLPYGLDVVQNLADQVLPELARRLNEEISAIDIDGRPFQNLINETEVGQLISGISEKTSHDKLRKLGTLSAIELSRVSEIDASLAEPDPAGKAKDFRLSANRLKEVVKRLESASLWVSDAAINRFKEFDDATVAANAAESAAADALQSGESLLRGTGDPGWKALFDAARKYSIELAYPEHAFPHIEDDAKCVLCQQFLLDSGERMRRFDEYIQNDVAKASALQREQLKATKLKIERADLTIGIGASLIEWIEGLDDVAAVLLTEFQTSMDVRRTWMLQGLDSHSWDAPPSLSENPRLHLRNLAARQLRSARIFTRAVDVAKKEKLLKERDELRARLNLSERLDEIIAFIDRMTLRQKLKTCEKDLKTRPISEMSKELASRAVTDTLKKALDHEFKVLGIGHIKTKLRPRPDKGVIKHQLFLDLPTTNKLDEILSEGEQRAIALGSFLAELKLADHGGGIIFDDPVSSMDHKRRRKVAVRLAEESQARQVLIFTHDVVFLDQLRSGCERFNLIPSFYFLESRGDYFGNVSEGLPWDHKSYKERLDTLEKAQKRFEKMPWPVDPSEELSREMVRQYSFLRATVERVAQDFVLNGTVQRFKDYIDVKKLSLVVGLLESEVKELLRINQRCHDLVEAHDPSSAKGEPVPDSDALKKDLDDLKALIQKITDRRKACMP